MRAAAGVLWLAAVAFAWACAAATAVPQRPVGVENRPLRILSIMTIDTMSHHLWMAPLTIELAKRGHNVVSVDVALPKEVCKAVNIRGIQAIIAWMFHNVCAKMHQRWHDIQ